MIGLNPNDSTSCFVKLTCLLLHTASFRPRRSSSRNVASTPGINLVPENMTVA